MLNGWALAAILAALIVATALSTFAVNDRPKFPPFDHLKFPPGLAPV
jgi:hypothetical protein